MRAVLALALVLAACTPPESEAPPAAPRADAIGPAPAPAGFDAQAWLAEARALATDADGFDARTAHAEALAEAVDWPTACDTYVDPETGEPVYDPFDGGFPRGDFEVADLGDASAVVAVVCTFGAYQGTYALVRIDGQDVGLLTAPALAADGRPLDVDEGWFGTPDFGGFEEGVLTTFMKSRGLGDCGRFVRYGVGDGDRLTVEEVRERDCLPDLPDDLPPPSAWPVVYSSS